MNVDVDKGSKEILDLVGESVGNAKSGIMGSGPNTPSLGSEFGTGEGMGHDAISLLGPKGEKEGLSKKTKVEATVSSKPGIPNVDGVYCISGAKRSVRWQTNNGP
ncbi:hypothetical protein ACFE04_026289 [Oxalis oulophora]